MNIDGLLYQFKNEEALRSERGKDHARLKKKSRKVHSAETVKKFKDAIKNGARLLDAAKKYGIPTSTARGMVPNSRKPEQRKLAVSMVKMKLNGELCVTDKLIATRTGYSTHSIGYIRAELLG